MPPTTLPMNVRRSITGPQVRRMECQEILCLTAAFNPIQCISAWAKMHRSTTAMERSAARPLLAGGSQYSGPLPTPSRRTDLRKAAGQMQQSGRSLCPLLNLATEAFVACGLPNLVASRTALRRQLKPAGARSVTRSACRSIRSTDRGHGREPVNREIEPQYRLAQS